MSSLLVVAGTQAQERCSQGRVQVFLSLAWRSGSHHASTLLLNCRSSSTPAVLTALSSGGPGLACQCRPCGPGSVLAARTWRPQGLVPAGRSLWPAVGL